jgi:hypothetical protein
MANTSIHQALIVPLLSLTLMTAFAKLEWKFLWVLRQHLPLPAPELI